MSDPSDIYTARPVILISGQENERVVSSLVSVRLDEQAGGLCCLELRLLNVHSEEGGGAELAFSGNSPFNLGVELEVDLGRQGDGEPMFRGKITSLEEVYGEDRAPELVILAEDALMQARMARRTVLHENVALSDLVQTIASRYGLRANTNGISGQLDLEVQLDESDLAFLRRVLEANDCELQAVGRELQAAPRTSINRGQVELNVHHQVNQCRITADLAHQVSSVTAAGWDDKQGQRFTASSAPSSFGPGSGKTGGQWLGQAFSNRAEHIAQPPVFTSEQANALVNAAHLQRARRFVVVEAEVMGNPLLRVGATVRLRGTSPRFENDYQVQWASHIYDLQNGYQTTFEATCAFLAESS